jgi:tetratricopeptide (TPR) repeat protein
MPVMDLKQDRIGLSIALLGPPEGLMDILTPFTGGNGGFVDGPAVPFVKGNATYVFPEINDFGRAGRFSFSCVVTAIPFVQPNAAFCQMVLQRFDAVLLAANNNAGSASWNKEFLLQVAPGQANKPPCKFPCFVIFGEDDHWRPSLGIYEELKEHMSIRFFPVKTWTCPDIYDAFIKISNLLAADIVAMSAWCTRSPALPAATIDEIEVQIGALLDKGEWIAAHDAAGEYAKRAQQAADIGGYVAALFWQAVALGNLRRFREAVMLVNQVLGIDRGNEHFLRNSKTVKLLLPLFDLAGDEEYQKGELTSALSWFKITARLASILDDRAGYIQARLNQSRVFIRKGEFQEALKIVKQEINSGTAKYDAEIRAKLLDGLIAHEQDEHDNVRPILSVIHDDQKIPMSDDCCFEALAGEAMYLLRCNDVASAQDAARRLWHAAFVCESELLQAEAQCVSALIVQKTESPVVALGMLKLQEHIFRRLNARFHLARNLLWQADILIADFLRISEARVALDEAKKLSKQHGYGNLLRKIAWIEDPIQKMLKSSSQGPVPDCLAIKKGAASDSTP